MLGNYLGASCKQSMHVPETPQNWLCQAAGVTPSKGESEATRSARSRGVSSYYKNA